MAPQDPDAYFAERGFLLSVAEQNRDPELPDDADSRGSTHWADLIRFGKVVARSYGAGHDEQQAKLNAHKRWLVEQEPPLG